MIQTVDLPPWDAVAVSQFKFHVAFSLFGIMFIALLIEGARVRAQNNLVTTQYQYQEAEQRQREINKELQQEFLLRIQSQKLLEQSEMRYRALFEESAVSLWEEDWSDLKTYLNNLALSATKDLDTLLKTDPTIMSACIEHIRLNAVNRATLALFEVDSMEALLNHIIEMMAPIENVAAGENRPGLLSQRIQALFTTGRFKTEVDTQSSTGKRLHLMISSTIPAGFEDSWSKIFTTVYDMTERILAYARGGKYQAGAISVSAVIKAILESDQIEMDATVRVDLELSGDIHLVSGDITQIQKVVEAIIFNAMESMSENGRLKISAKNHTVEQSDSDIANGKSKGNTQLAPGNYVAIAFQDNGSGMDNETRERIFKPFFSTKFFGRGLGMAAASDIIENHGGMITVDSTPGQGTLVMVYLPISV